MLDAVRLARFSSLFSVPPVALPYLDVIFAPSDLRLVLAANGVVIDLPRARHELGVDDKAARAALEDGYSRGLFNREGTGDQARYHPTDFYSRLDCFATYDRWHDLPEAARRQLDEWMLGEYVERVRPNVERLRAGLRPERIPGNDSVLLLSELDAVIDAAKTIVVIPCNCRSIAENCKRPLDVCLQFDAGAEGELARGHGRRLSHSGAKELVRWADQKGLMHTTDLNSDQGPAPICNCCGDDCYVFRAARRLDTKGIWPHVRFVATYDQTKCDLCGACVRRCHFGAFRHEDGTQPINGRARRPLTFDETLCWGCGLCANTCPQGAIVMTPLP